MVVGIDGTSATGKGTIAKAIGEKFGFMVIDTGAILRGGAVAFLEKGLDADDEKTVNEFAKKLNIKIKFENGNQLVFVDGVDKTPYLRSEEVSRMTSKLCVYPNFLNSKNPVVREFAETNDCVVDGRDICTEVLPNADVKFYFQADAKVRARRRVEQLLASGQDADFDKVLDELVKRDERDMTRENSPLKPAVDSIIIDNSNQTQEETIEQCFAIIESKIKK